jgi:peroxiredoxin
MNNNKTRRWIKKILIAAFAVWTVFLAYKVKNPKQHTKTSNELLRKQAIDFSLIDLTGQKHTLSDYRGKYVVLNFFASWCSPCREELPDFVKYANEHEDIVFLGINMGEPKDEVQELVTEYKISFPILLDIDKKVANSYRVNAIPITIIVNPDGDVKDVRTGKIASPERYFDRQIYNKELKTRKKRTKK